MPKRLVESMESPCISCRKIAYLTIYRSLLETVPHTVYRSHIGNCAPYCDLVWGDKHNITLMSSLQVLQNKAAKGIIHVTKAILDYHVSKEIGGSKEHKCRFRF